MATASAQVETISGVSGVRFTTDARQGTDQETKLQEIQSVLSGRVVILPSGTTLPHLALCSVQVVDGTSYAVISLRVPTDRRQKAVELLEAAGFTVS